jgi:hypothetical protein
MREEWDLLAERTGLSDFRLTIVLSASVGSEVLFVLGTVPKC